MSSSGLRGPALNRYFGGAVAVILLCSLGLGANVLTGYYRIYENSAVGLQRLLAFRTVLDAARSVSSERGPTNAALGRSSVGDAARAGRLAIARQATDAAIAAIDAHSVPSDAVAALKDQLSRARGDADRVLNRPSPERDPAEVEGLVNAMFAAYDLTQPLIDAATNAAITKGANLMGRAVTARMLGEMRDQSGRLGSYIVIAIAQGHPMTVEQGLAFATTQGRVFQLWQLIQQQVAIGGSAEVMEARRDTARIFMQDGLQLIAATHDRIAQGAKDLTTAGFTQAIVPNFKPIEQLRDVYLDMTVEELRQRRATAEQALAFASVGILLTLALELVLLLASQRLFFRPLLQARDEVVRLAEGRLERAVARPLLRGEMRSLFDSLATCATG